MSYEESALTWLNPANDYEKVWKKPSKKKKKNGWLKIPRLRNILKNGNRFRLNIPQRFQPYRHVEIGPCICHNCVEKRKGKYIFEQGLKKHGFELLGHGYYSKVYAKPGNNRVLKVTKADDNWYDYISWARESGWAGKFAPMVYSYKKVSFKGDTFFLASMERMSSDVGRLRPKDGPSFYTTLVQFHQFGNPLAKQMIRSYNPDLHQFLDDFFEKFKDEGRFDLHGGNMMIREDQSFCLTDPICGSKRTEYRRLRERELSRTLRNLFRSYFESSIRHRS